MHSLAESGQESTFEQAYPNPVIKPRLQWARMLGSFLR
jgi:hypothetical protein